MAQPIYPVLYLGSVACEGGKAYTSASVLATYATANCLIMKGNGVSVSVDASPMFSVSYDDQSYIETGHTYVFNKDCVLAVGRYKVVT